MSVWLAQQELSLPTSFASKAAVAASLKRNPRVQNLDLHTAGRRSGGQGCSEVCLVCSFLFFSFLITH